MSETVAVDPGSDRYRRLAELLEEEGSERTIVRESLELVRSEVGARAVSAYVPGRSGYEMVGSVGRNEDPLHRDEPLSEDEVGHRVGEGFVLIHGAPDRRELSDEARLVLAAGLRLCRYRARLRDRDFDAKYRGVELEVMYDVGTAVASTLDLEELAEEILLRAVSLLDARRGALYLRDEDLFRLHRTIGGSAVEGVPVGETEEERDASPLLPGAEHVLSVPIEVDRRTRGLLVVGDKESRVGIGPFAETDRRSLEHFATQAAIALEQARLHREALEKERLEREMELASQIQRGILPASVPEIPGFDLLAWTRPARHVGGDYYDFIRLPDDRTAIVLADVSGKGVPAALLVSTVHAALRLLLERELGLAPLCELLNRHLLRFSAMNKFVTLFLGEVDPRHRQLHFVNAGHNPALVAGGAAEVDWLDATGVPLGLLPEASWEEQERDVAPGETLCIYSDGVTEATSPEEEELGSGRLAELIRRDARTLPEIRDSIQKTLREFTRGSPQGDDQTVVLLRRAD